jgi:hypothetical protein
MMRFSTNRPTSQQPNTLPLEEPIIQSVITWADGVDGKKGTASDVEEGDKVTAADGPVGQLLPIELEVYLLSFLNKKDFWSASRVCRRWTQAALIAGQHKSLHLSHRTVDQQAVETLVNLPFSRLFLPDCNLGVEALIVLSQSTHLRELNLADNPEVGDEGVKALTNGCLTSLTSLNLGSNNIGAEGAEALANGHFNSLTSLNLQGNRIGAEGAKAIANGCLNSLISLNLQRNYIGPEGAKALANGHLNSLTSLDLRGNSIGDEGAKAIGNGCLNSLTSLDLRGNYIGDEGAKALQKNKSITNLNI